MPNGIPGKGKILTAISLWWFAKFSEFENHLISTKIEDYPPELREHRDQIEGRSMLVKKAAVIPIECVARGYVAGSGWKDYLATQAVCGIKLPAGLKQCDKLPAAIFTPAEPIGTSSAPSSSASATTNSGGRVRLAAIRSACASPSGIGGYAGG